jgi:hypothetical protein
LDATTVVKFVAVAADDTETDQELAGYVKAAPDSIAEDWASSGHGHISADAWRHWDEDGEVDADNDDVMSNPTLADGCAKCHGGPVGDPSRGFLQFAETGANADAAPLPLGLECAACHGDPFLAGTIYSDAMNYPFVQDVEFPSFLSADYGNPSNLCMSCHQGRESKVQVDDTIAASAGPYGFLNIHYFAAAATLFGTDVKGGYEYDFQPGAGGAGGAPAYRGENPFTSHGTVLNDCIACHMNADVDDDKNHTFMPELASCAPCHGNPPPSFPELTGTPGTNFDDIETLLGELLPLIETYANDVIGMPIVYSSNYPYFCNDNGNPCNFANGYKDFDAKLLRAAYNYQTGQKEPAGYIHNGAYIKQLLFDSITDLGGTPSVTRP